MTGKTKDVVYEIFSPFQAQRDFELKKAAYDVEVQTKKAEAEMAYELQAAKTKQRIKEEQMQIKVVERTQEILVQDQEMQRRERELEATIRRPAEAEKYRLEKLAEANKNRVIMEAEGEAESIRIRGEAEAFAIAAKAKAEAEQMAKKAEAWKEYKDAAMVDLLMETLPKVSRGGGGGDNVLENFLFINSSPFRSLRRLPLLCPRPRRSRWCRRAVARWALPS